MKLIIGLGNPGEKYQHNRHNVGYTVIDALQKVDLPKDVVIKKTGVFMNDSGSTVKSLYTKYKIQYTNLYVIHDDLDIRLGEYKIQKGTGPKDHKGIQSIEKELRENDFWRVRIGVDNRDPENRIVGEDYVLQDFSQEELEIVQDVIRKLISDLKQRL